MVRYKNFSGDSGVTAYETGEDSIIVQFKNGGMYLYNYSRTGSGNIKEMKRLALTGKGLCTFINKYVKDKYASKIR